MGFEKFSERVQKQFRVMCKYDLYQTKISGRDLWDIYLQSFPEGSNPLFLEKTEHDCNACKSFIRNYGNLVAVVNNKLVSIWDIPLTDTPYAIVAQKLSEAVKSFDIRDMFFTNTHQLGKDYSIKLIGGKTFRFAHLFLAVKSGHNSVVDSRNVSIASRKSVYNANKSVFKRSMEELTLESGEIILDLIGQKSLYRGEEHRKAIKEFILAKKTFTALPEEEKDNWCWDTPLKINICRIRNTAIGTLLIDISENIDLDVAVRKFENVMAPTNYKRPKPIFTKRMIEDAQKKIESLGFTESLQRRFATLEDISVKDILYINRDVKQLKGNIFDKLKEDTVDKIKNLDKVEKVSAEDFIKNILPKATNVEVMLENKHKGNLLSLVTSNSLDSKNMFKWNNNFSWSYNGELTDSIKQNVSKAGGNVDGVLRFSIQWNTGEYNQNDFDAHCIEPNGRAIYFSRMRNTTTTGFLDVDIISPARGVPSVENIAWTNKGKMEVGEYTFLVHNYSHQGGTDGFQAEIEFEGQIYSFEYPNELKHKEKVIVAKIHFDGQKIKFIDSLKSATTTKTVWGVTTNKFIPVSAIMFSPNFWEGAWMHPSKSTMISIGNKHYFFFLKGCKNETTPRGFFNEFLNEELTKHRKVLEAIGSNLKVKEDDNQLSGVGFSTTQRNNLLVRVEGSFKRILNVEF